MTYAHILLVDDEHIVLDILESVLSDAGFKISRAATSEAALEIFERDDVHLLMTDIKMPGSLDGVLLASRMREKKPQLPVIFLSGNLDGLANSDQVAAPSAFLVKPFNMDEAIETINLLITGKSSSVDLIHNRAALPSRQITEQPTGTPTSGHHAVGTAHGWEEEEKPVRESDSSRS